MRLKLIKFNEAQTIYDTNLQRIYLLQEFAALTISKADYMTVITMSRM